LASSERKERRGTIWWGAVVESHSTRHSAIDSFPAKQQSINQAHPKLENPWAKLLPTSWQISWGPEKYGNKIHGSKDC
jgi:hypothetical protein